MYRNGWYVSKNRSEISFETNSILNNFRLQKAPRDYCDKTDTLIESRKSKDSIGLSSVKVKSVISDIAPEDTFTYNHPIKKMSYAEARASLERKGSVPNEAALNVYNFSLISIAGFVLGVGIFLSIATLIYSLFAVKKVIADGNCVEENLAIIRAGQRISWISIIITALLFILVIALILYIIQIAI